MRLKIKTLMLLLFTLLLLAISTVISSVDPIFAILLFIWFACIIYAYSNIKERAMLFAFLVSFFVFLLGRDLVQQYFSYKVESFSKDAEIHAWISFSISLIVICLGYHFFAKKNKKTIINKEQLIINSDDKIYKNSIRKISLIIFYISWIFSVIANVQISKYIANSSFLDYYTEYSEYLRGNIFLYIISKVELVMPVAWSVYLGTMPQKHKIRIPLIMYILYLIISLGTGQRSTAMLGLLSLFVYFLFRDKSKGETWISKKMIITIIIILPFLAVFISLYDLWREGISINSLDFGKGIMEFFYDQGVTSNIVKRAYTYENFIPKQIYTLEFMHSGILARIFNIPVYHGNTIEHALYGGSFTHSLAYTIMRSSYLSGRGTGSSYIAELYYDFGYIGIVLGNLLYSFIIYKISTIDKNHFMSNGYKIMIIPFILWAPRGSFTYFLSQSLSPIIIATFVLIFLGSYLLVYNKLLKNKKDD